MNEAEYVKIIEDMCPLGSHPRFYDTWADDIRESATVVSELDHENLESVIEFRLAVASAASVGPALTEESTDWKWLLDVKQVEQRTEEWYSETRNILTASEVSSVFKGGRTRGALVMSKLAEPRSIGKPLALPRSITGPMDWGVRYEPVIKTHLEKTLGRIHELGRIRHRTDSRIAASPDGLFIEGDLAGSLIEIKCPYTREINDKIPFEYWCQMQLQMEVCDRPACEYVEVKFKEHDASIDIDSTEKGWIRLESDGESCRYVYEKGESIEPWTTLEEYQWEIVKLRRITVLRDPTWFQESQAAFDEFWKDVEGARAGTWKMEPKERKKNVKCGIID